MRLIGAGIIFSCVVGIGLWARGADESTPRVVKVSLKKLEVEVMRAIKDGRAEIASFGGCQSECSANRNLSERDVEYDKHDESFVYELPSAKVGSTVAAISVAGSDLKVFGNDYVILPISNCSSFWSDVRNGQKKEVVGKPPYELSIQYGIVRLGENSIDLLEPYCRINSAEGHRIVRGFHIQSIVGPIVNIVSFESDRTEGWTHDAASAEWISWNLKENRRAELTDVFEPDSVLRALKSDKVMQQRFFKGHRKELNAATELSVLMRAIEKDPRQNGSRIGWQIVSYDPVKYLANVQYGFYGDCCNSVKIFKMGLDLKVRSEFHDLFSAAKTNGLINIRNEARAEAKNAAPAFQRVFESLVVGRGNKQKNVFSR